MEDPSVYRGHSCEVSCLISYKKHAILIAYASMASISILVVVYQISSSYFMQMFSVILATLCAFNSLIHWCVVITVYKITSTE